MDLRYIAKLVIGGVVLMCFTLTKAFSSPISNYASTAILNEDGQADAPLWKVGIGREKITPKENVWLAGFAIRREPKGVLTDLWVKAMVLQTPLNKRAIIVTLDLVGLSHTVYETVYQRLKDKFDIDRADISLMFSHTHSGPLTFLDLADYYPTDDEQNGLVENYTRILINKIEEVVGSALSDLRDARVYIGEGKTTFAVNRRENRESEVTEMTALSDLKGPIDYSVPVLLIKNLDGTMRSILFGYACHATTLHENMYSGDYPGFAQKYLEEKYPGVTAMFFAGAGADINPLPRGTVELCEKYGKMLSDAVTDVVSTSMTELEPRLKTAFKFASIPYEEVARRDTLMEILRTENAAYRIRAARNMLYILDKGIKFSGAYRNYPLQVWSLGGQLLFVMMGGEAVLDYNLKFKSIYDKKIIWTSGFANSLVAYIPTRRIIREGGYEGGHLDEYGLPAWKWDKSIEDVILRNVAYLVKQVD